MNWRVHHLVNKGVIQRIGRGLFKIGKEVEFVPAAGRREIRIYNQLKRELPFLDSCVWNFDAIKEFTQHIPSVKLTIVEVERHSTESVFYLLRETHKQVFYKSQRDLRNGYFHNLENAILIRPLVTEAPLQETDKLTTITIEKMLVDIFSDEDFDFLRGFEMTHIFKNAFQAYTINQSKMLRYAFRKNKKEELLTFLKTYNLAVI
ncbi:DUF6577 family protein [Nafulsella turpanensis]|uniref:DUF6577 family protein n=1 Tax=Nafulsella turpanensis TaxID=1265690 RepID=UPI0029349570|nr:DUF6577 family protein [Nafulsella turpanensis]